jgi:hypothetical protein
VRWLVAGACWVRDLSGVDTSETLRSRLRRLSARIGDFDAKLDALERSGDAHVSEMAKIASLVMSGEDLPGLRGRGSGYDD